MSDFGTHLTVHRTNGSSTTDAEEATVKALVKEMTSPHKDRINVYSDFNLRFGGSSNLDGSNGICVGLTEYRLGDDERNEGLDDEVLIARDCPTAERFGEELQQKLGSDYIVEVYCGHW